MNQTARVAVYLRISKDDELEGLGVDRQLRECRDYCLKRGWEISEVFTDNDVSAWSGRRRPAFEDLLSAMSGRRVDGVVAWHLDRLWRRAKDLERFLDVAETAGMEGRLGTCYGDYDLGTADGRFQVRILISVAQKESDDKSRRLRSKHAELASAGAWKGGPRCYGYDARHAEIVPEEAERIREAAERILSGEGCVNVARDWNARGVKTISPDTVPAWTAQAIKRLLMAPRIAGLRAHRRSGSVVAATWPGVISAETHERLRAVLTDPRRGIGRETRRYLLSGFVVCECGSRMVSHVNSVGLRRWHCRSAQAQPGQNGCGRCAVLAVPVERIVWESCLAVLERPQNLARVSSLLSGTDDEGSDVLERLRALEGRLDALRTKVAEGVLEPEDFAPMRDRIRAEMEELRRSAVVGERYSILDGLTPETLRAEVSGWEQDRRRALIEAVLSGPVLIRRANRAGGVFRPERIGLEIRLGGGALAPVPAAS